MKLNLGENIRIQRRKINWTQEQLADRLGVSGQSVSRWEKGATYPDMEFLPVMAKLFGCTTDDLLGCAEPEKKLTTNELGDMLWEAIRNNDAEKTAEVLRTVRYDYLDEFSELDYLMGNIRPGTPLYGNENVMEEYRLTVNAYQERGKWHSMRPYMIHRLCTLEDDEHMAELVQRHRIPENCDMSNTGLYLSRARHTRNLPLVRRLAQEKKIQYIYNLVTEPICFLEDGAVDHEDPWSCERNAEPGDPLTQKYASRRKLKLLHDYTGITPDSSHPVTGDGELDIWAAAYLDIGFKYAAQLAETGECDLALTALEDCAGLVEKLMDFPEGFDKYKNGYYAWKCPALPVRAPDLNLVRAYRAPVSFLVNSEKRDTPIGVTIGICGDYPGEKFIRSFFSRSVLLDFEDMLTLVYKPTDNFRSSWYNPIRRHPRYLAVIERIHAVIPWQVSDCPHRTLAEAK